MAGLTLRSLKKSFGDEEVIRGVDLDVAEGEFVVLVGPSGCGKSTLLRLVSGLESSSEGSIVIGGEDVTQIHPSRRGVAMVFQSYALFPHMTVADNIGFGLRLQRTRKATRNRMVREVAAALQIDDLLDKFPRQLSGGQRQRVAIGRAIIRSPKIFLFDEPLSNLDASLRVQMRLEIARLHQRLGVTVIYVTHDQTEAMTLADKIVVFNKGTVEQVGTPMSLYDRPANKFVAEFIGAPSMNLIPVLPVRKNGRILAELEGTEVCDLGAHACESRIWLGVRPEHLLLARSGQGDFGARVELVEELGVESLAYLQVGFEPSTVTMRLSPPEAIRVGDRIAIRLDRDRVHLFDDIGNRIESG